jgi:hypothetical protein
MTIEDDAMVQVAGVNCSGYAPANVATPGYRSPVIDKELSDFAEQQWALAHPASPIIPRFEVVISDQFPLQGEKKRLITLISCAEAQRRPDRSTFYTGHDQAKHDIWRWVRGV